MYLVVKANPSFTNARHLSSRNRFLKCGRQLVGGELAAGAPAWAVGGPGEPSRGGAAAMGAGGGGRRIAVITFTLRVAVTLGMIALLG